MIDEERPTGDDVSPENPDKGTASPQSSDASTIGPKDKGQNDLSASSKETIVGSTETIVSSSAHETQVSDGPEAQSSAAETGQDSGKGSGDPGGQEESNGQRKNSGLLVGGVIAVILLIVVGLFLPPISLGERLGLTGEGEAEMTVASEELAVSDSLTLSLTAGDSDVQVEQISSDSFLKGEAGKEWQAAAEALPDRLTLVSDVYALDYDQDQPPYGSAAIEAAAETQPYQTLDLYGWDGSGWFFMPSDIDEQDSFVNSAEATLPPALALMQTAPPANLEIGAEVLPIQSLPAAVLPFLTEVAAGTLTLGPNGSLLGEAVTVPGGAYSQLLRATNTGAIVDVPSLATMLADPALQKQNIDALVAAVSEGGYDGLNLDYQGVPVELKKQFTEFNQSLAEELHAQGADLVVILETPLLMDGEWDTAGQDWAALGATADAVYPQMPLDPRSYGDSQLAEQIVNYATRQIDRGKLSALNSVNAVDSVANVHREVEHMDALADFGEITFVEGSDEVEPGDDVEITLSGTAGALAWDPASLTYQYSYEQADQEHQVWLGSEALLSHRGRFANRYNLRGLAIRGLGSLDFADGYAKALASFVGSDEPPQPASAAIVWTVEDDSGAVVASSTGEEMNFSWEAPEEPGEYLIQAKFAQGDTVSDLASKSILVANLLAEVEPEPTEEPEEEEATPTPAPTSQANQPSSVDPGDSDAAANTPANVRSGPGLGYGIVGGLQSGQKVKLIGRNEDVSWLNIEMGDGSEGWVFAQLLTVNSTVNVNALAVIEVDPPTVASSGGGGSAPPPVIAPAGGGSFELGGQTHTLANPTLMKSAGMNWVKFQHKWGSGDSPDAIAGRIQQAHANGMKVLLSIPGANAYPNSIDFNGYVEFLRGVAAQGPDAIEIWNEMNIDFEWPAGQIDPASYVNNMLAPAYNAIKSANSSVMVISGAPAPTGFDNGTNAWSDARYMAGVAAAGGGNYMDCIGVHHNAGATSPNAQSGHPAGGTHYSWYFWPTLNMYYNSFGGARPVCFTELGYLSGQDFGGVPSRFSWAANTSVGQHAQWLAEAASLSANSGKVRMMIIFNVDFTHWGDDPQAGYAMLRPDGSCPSCGSLGQVMGR